MTTAATPRAPAIAAKLGAAQDRLASLRNQLFDAVAAGADGKRIAGLRTEIATASTDVEMLTGGHSRALELDAADQALADAAARDQQLAELEKIAARRGEVLKKLFNTVPTMVEAIRELEKLSAEFAVAWPTGLGSENVPLLLANVGLLIGRDGTYANGPENPVTLEMALRSEIWRLGSSILGAKSPSMSTSDPAAVEPAVEAALRMQSHLIQLAKARFEELRPKQAREAA